MDDRERGEVYNLAGRVEELLYDLLIEEQEGEQQDEEDDEAAFKSIQLAVELCWQQLELMERRGYKVLLLFLSCLLVLLLLLLLPKVVSQLHLCWKLVEIAQEWEMEDTLRMAAERGALLTGVGQTFCLFSTCL